LVVNHLKYIIDQRNTPNLKVWFGIMKDGFIGPFFFQKATVTNHSYLDVLEHNTVPQLPCDAWFQHDGTLLSFGHKVRHFLNETSPNMRITWDPILVWPPRSPDITPLEFFYRGYVKYIVYQENVTDLRTLRLRITEAIAAVTEVALLNTWHEIEYRFDVCPETCGTHTKNCY
jgi:hypothetical protein